ncbi:MAG TPA: hypothetical protein VMI54_09965 [Polyangiaceae bacterium]|nr:hypothetical protein [Polyangiaceae bacterium]
MADEVDEDLEPVAPSATEPTGESLGARLLARAKKAGDHAHASAADLTSKVGDLREHAAVAASEFGDLTAAKMGELKEAGMSALVDALDDFNAALPAAREAGYALQGINLALGLPPRVTATFAATDKVTPENVEHVLATHADRKFTLVLIKSLYQAWQVQRKIHVVGLKPSSLSVLIGFPPSVSINFA